ncbi:MAG: tetratricopeptide (TPR) repeat protein, partial [Saprospiraceae bacterium]
MRLLKKLTLLMVALLLSTGVFAQSALKKANKQYELKAYELAIKSYQKFLKKKPANVVALNRIADSYRHLNNMQAAAKYYKQAVKSSKVAKEAHLNYGKVLMALGDYTEASGSFSKYVGTDPVATKQYKNSVAFAYVNRNNPITVDINNEFINTSGDDFAAIPFGNRVVFSSTRQDLKRA